MSIRTFLPLAMMMGFFLPACADPESFEDDDSENVGETEGALTTVTNSRDAIPNINCDPATSTVQLALGSGLGADTLAPWKSLSANGTFLLGNGANGAQLRYWIDGNSSYSQTDSVASNAAAGTWSWTRSGVSCSPHSFTVCAIPYAGNSACGDLTAPTSAGYRTCQSVSFRGCATAIGVIPDYATACPVDADTIIAHMDDEDHRNANSSSGWIGKTVSNANTDLAFCRVDGTNFKSLTSCSSDPTRDYAVLKLGSACPNGSAEFWKNIDNEDSNNKNSIAISSGDFFPNTSDRNTTLHFCLFSPALSASSTMGYFPALGSAYGIFGTSSLVSAGAASTAGWFHSDDEDSDNQNAFFVASGAPWDTSSRAQKLISNDGNTNFYTAKANTAIAQGTGALCPPPPPPPPPPPKPTGGCFVAGTQISLADGSTRPIEDVKAGDQVLAYDIDSGHVVSSEVTETFVHPDLEGTVLINGHLQATANHPVYANGRWVRADELSVGDRLLQLSPNNRGTEAMSYGDLGSSVAGQVAALVLLPGAQTTFNLEVANQHNYFAGGFLVHNKIPLQDEPMPVEP
jgi:Pretoxin HINT domain